MKPTLWRVRAYFGPGFPSPTMSAESVADQMRLAAGARAAGAPPAAALDRRPASRLRSTVGARDLDRDDDGLGRRDQREALRQRDLRGQ